MTQRRFRLACVAGTGIQGGDPRGDGTGGPGYTVVERPPERLHYTRGIVGMARTASEPEGASGSQFFIVTARNAQLPPAYAWLGRVVKAWTRSTASKRSAVAVAPTVPLGGPS